MHHLSAQALSDLFCKGEVTAEAIADTFLKRIAHHDQALGAFLSVFSERVKEKAYLLDQKRKEGKPLGKLAGIPIALKDNILLKGEITTCASKFLENYKAVYDATTTRLLEEADALIIGKTNLDEFAMGSSTENSAYHTTKNPWDLTRTPGGSSGGSAAAVGARLVPLAFGSETGGSVRQPASFCGIAGFKPTYGRVSRYGLVAFGSSFDQISPCAHSVEDIALALETVAHPCERDSTSIQIAAEPYVEKLKTLPKGGRIGIPRDFLKELSSETKENFENSLALLKELGYTLVDVDLSLLKYSVSVYYILTTAEASTNLARFDGIRYGKRSTKATTLDEVYDLSKQEGFGKEVKKRILLGTYVLSSGYKNAYYKKAQKVRTLMIEQFNRAFSACDLIAMPTSPQTAFKIGAIQDSIQMYLQDIFTICANIAGIPALSVPSGFDKTGLPFGLQLLGPQMHDAQVLACGHHFEQATLFSKKIPPLFEHEVKA